MTDDGAGVPHGFAIIGQHLHVMTQRPQTGDAPARSGLPASVNLRFVPVFGPAANAGANTSCSWDALQDVAGENGRLSLELAIPAHRTVYHDPAVVESAAAG